MGNEESVDTNREVAIHAGIRSQVYGENRIGRVPGRVEAVPARQGSADKGNSNRAWPSYGSCVPHLFLLWPLIARSRLLGEMRSPDGSADAEIHMLSLETFGWDG